MALEKSTSPTETEIYPFPVESNTSTGALDDNYEVYKNARGTEIDPLEAKEVLRKIDRRILSILMVTYILQYLDKNCVNIASVYGLKKDTHLEGQDYSWLSMY